jgi:hypothetical protein
MGYSNGPSAAAEKKKETQAQKTARPAQPSPEAESVLQKIDQGGSRQEIEQALRDRKLSETQRKELARALSEPPYSDKLKRLQEEHQVQVPARALRESRSIEEIRRQHERALKRSHQRRLAEVNDQYKTRMVKVKPTTSRAQNAMRKPQRSSLSTVTSTQRRYMGAASQGSITSVSPSAVQVGDLLTIQGRELGSSPGRVVVLVGESMEPCQLVGSWSESRLQVRIPASVAPLVGGRSAQAKIWVKLGGGETGPVEDITLRPDRSLLQPTIAMMSGTEITPKQSFAIQGTNFLSTGRGRVAFSFAGEHFPLKDTDVTSWGDTGVEIKMPLIYGLMREGGWIIVTNHVGEEARAPITYIPMKGSYEYHTPGRFGSGYAQTTCLPLIDQAENDPDSGLWALCVFGRKKEWKTGLSLKNGWSVYDVGYTHLTSWGRGVSCGAYLEKEPVMGRSGYIEAESVVWVNGCNACRFRESWFLEGPRGVPFDREYDPSEACVMHDLRCD